MYCTYYFPVVVFWFSFCFCIVRTLTYYAVLYICIVNSEHDLKPPPFTYLSILCLYATHESKTCMLLSPPACLLHAHSCMPSFADRHGVARTCSAPYPSACHRLLLPLFSGTCLAWAHLPCTLRPLTHAARHAVAFICILHPCCS